MASTNKRVKNLHTSGMWKKNRAPIVPVTILTGYLGSGKTTLLNHILKDASHGMKFAVIQNEFGDVGVDEHTLSENVVEEELVEVMNGCICCTVRGDLVTALKSLYERIEQFNGVIIETTGLADPAPVCQTFFVGDEDIRKMYRLDSVITMVDAMHIMDCLREKKPEGIENEAIEQVCFSDKILLNKIDLVAADDKQTLNNIEAKLKALNPTTTIQRTEYSKINVKDILNIQAFELDRVLDFDPEFLNENREEHLHDTTVTSVAVKTEGDVDYRMLQCWIRRLIDEEGANLYRYKGVISVKDAKKKFIFQGVGKTFTGGFGNDRGDGDNNDDDIFSWNDDEKRESRFVFIGKNLDHEFYRNGFMACLVTAKLRFPVGTMVEAKVGIFQKGMVIKQRDNGNAYQIQLQNENKTNIWAPVDVDAYVRSSAAA